MDRREAMLREMNLYPLWVRRGQPVPDMMQAVKPVIVVENTEVMQAQSPVECAAGQIVSGKGLDEQDNLLINIDKLSDQVAGENQLSSADTLREFQLKNAGGVLGRLNWPELKQKVGDCELCKLRAGCTQTVFGTGDGQAYWMFIGEAPGAEEDASGEPFVGHAGRLLDNMLMSIKLKRGANVYIANVIKCRPPEDRHPHVGEISACLPYLRRQIDLIKPGVIVALGKTASSALLETDATIASLRGQLHEYKGIPLVVTFHPAYLLRNPMEKAKAWQDLCLAVDTMQGVSSGAN